MIHLEPKQMRVNAVYLMSREQESDEVVRDRRAFLGLFVDSVSLEEIEQAIDDANLWYRVVASATMSGGLARFSVIPRVITEGLVFENPKEFVQYLQAGLHYEDLIAGYSMARNVDVQI